MLDKNVSYTRVRRIKLARNRLRRWEKIITNAPRELYGPEDIAFSLKRPLTPIEFLFFQSVIYRRHSRDSFSSREPAPKCVINIIYRVTIEKKNSYSVQHSLTENNIWRNLKITSTKKKKKRIKNKNVPIIFPKGNCVKNINIIKYFT